MNKFTIGLLQARKAGMITLKTVLPSQAGGWQAKLMTSHRFELHLKTSAAPEVSPQRSSEDL